MKKKLWVLGGLVLFITGCKGPHNYEEAVGDVPEKIQEMEEKRQYNEEFIQFEKKYHANIAKFDAQYARDLSLYKKIWIRDKDKDPGRSVQLDSTIDGKDYLMSYQITNAFYTNRLSDVEVPEGYYDSLELHDIENGETIGQDILLVMDVHIENLSGETIPVYKQHFYDVGFVLILDDEGNFYRYAGSEYDSFQPGDKTDTMYFSMYEYPNFENGTGIDVRYACLLPEIYIEKANICPMIENSYLYSYDSDSFDENSMALFHLQNVSFK